jgi:hypothetical protein
MQAAKVARLRVGIKLLDADGRAGNAVDVCCYPGFAHSPYALRWAGVAIGARVVEPKVHDRVYA